MTTYRFDIPGIDTWVGKTKTLGLKAARMASRELARRVIDDAPVDTGFMVATAKVRLNPKGPAITGFGWKKTRERPIGYGKPEARELKTEEFNAKSTTMRLGDTLALSFVASYTQYVHEGIGQPAQPFITSNAAAWPAICRQAAIDAKAGK